MTDVLRDSTNPNNIPAGTPIVGGYVDGRWGPSNPAAWTPAAWARWAAAGARLRRIAAVTVNTRSNTADVESQDLTPADAPVWHRNMTALGEVDLWVYVNLSNRVATEDALWAAGVPLSACSMWIATLNGRVEALSVYRYPIAAQQWIDTGSYDESVVYETSGGGGGIITALVRRTTILANGSLHQFLRGIDNKLYHRRCLKGAWSAWTNLGGILTADTISGGVDDQGVLRVTVVGNPDAAGGTLYDISSADDGLTWSAFSDSHGAGTGLVTISGYAGVAEAGEPSKITLDITSVPGTATGTIS